MIQDENEKLLNAYENIIRHLENEVVSLKAEINLLKEKVSYKLLNEIQNCMNRASNFNHTA